MTIELDTVAESFELLDRVLTHPGADALALADLYARATKYHEERHHDVCLITAWAIVERLLNRVWDEYSNDGEGPPGGSRLRAWEMIEVLTETEQLPPGLYDEISAVRRARNAWIHALEPVVAENSEKAVRVAEAMIARCFDVRFVVPLRPGQRYQEYDHG